jgi:hypothetical protein
MAGTIWTRDSKIALAGVILFGLAAIIGVPIIQRRLHLDMSGHPSIMTGIFIPTVGCWQITGDYKGDKLTFVIWVEPQCVVQAR